MDWNYSDRNDLWADNVIGENLRIFRSFLNLSQKEFIDKYFNGEDGSLQISISKLSMAENGALSDIDPILEQLSKKTFIPREQFEMIPEQFQKSLFRFAPASQSYLKNEYPSEDRADIKSAVKRLSDYLADSFFHGTLKRGDKLPTIQKLSEQFGIKKSLLREAIQVLTVMGILDARQGNGVYLCTTDNNFYMMPLTWRLFLSEKNSEDIVSIRFLLDGEAARLTAQSASNDGLKEVKQVFDKMTAAFEQMDLAAYLDLDMQFHLVIARICGNQTIEGIISPLYALFRSYSAGGMVYKKDIIESHLEHQKIWNSIASHDGENARKAVEEHRDSAIRRFKRNRQAGFHYSL